MGRTVVLHDFPPKRIVSLVPSQTELLFDLGLEDEVVAITKFCVHPVSWFRNKARIGGTKHLDVKKIALLQPDLIIANKEENVREQVEALEGIAPVWISDVGDLESALVMIRAVGAITGCASKGVSLAADIQNSFDGFGRLMQQSVVNNLAVLYLIWKDPLITVGNDTFIHAMMQRCGFVNLYGDDKRYPTLTEEEALQLKPEAVLLSSEPFPFKEKHIVAIQKTFPSARIVLVDGEMFSWYGSRLLQAVDYFKKLVQQMADVHRR